MTAEKHVATLIAAWERLWRIAEDKVRAEEEGLGGQHVDDHYRQMVMFAKSHEDDRALLTPAVAREVLRLGDPADPGPLTYEAVACVAHATRWPEILAAANSVRPRAPLELQPAVDWIVDAFRDDWDGQRMYDCFATPASELVGSKREKPE